MHHNVVLGCLGFRGLNLSEKARTALSHRLDRSPLLSPELQFSWPHGLLSCSPRTSEESWVSQTVGPTDSQLARGQGSEVPLGSLAGVPVEFKISLRPWTLSRAFGLLPSDGLPVYHQTGSA